MNNAPEPKVIATATIADTDVTVEIVRRWVKRSEISKCLTATYVVTRRPGTAPFVNFLSCGRDTLSEARAVANYLFADAVTRRDDVRNRTCTLCGEEWADAATAVRCERDHYVS